MPITTWAAAMTTKPCKHCGSDKHTSLMCFSKPRTALKSNRKAINRVGPVTAKWIETRNEWIQQNHTETGTWNCYICYELLTIETLTLDHVKSRSRHPELRFDLNNLKPCCASCNSKKGSRDLLEMEGK